MRWKRGRARADGVSYWLLIQIGALTSYCVELPGALKVLCLRTAFRSVAR